MRSAGVSPAGSGGVPPLDVVEKNRARRPVNPPAKRLRYGGARMRPVEPEVGWLHVSVFVLSCWLEALLLETHCPL
jgi:hypothetical protein